MGNNLISIIIPVYNVEKYLPGCLDSILAQTYQDIEVICVDDGSTDDSLDILKKYQEKNKIIKVITQENKGAGAARNAGLAAAKGAYLSFLDADDFFEISMLEKAHQKIIETDADFVLFDSDQYLMDVDKYIPGANSMDKNLLPLDKDVFSYKNIGGSVFKSMLGWAWDKLFSAKFVKAEGLKFLEQHNTEDLFFVYSALVKARKIALVPEVLAHQRIRPGESLSMSREKYGDDFLKALIRLKQELEKMGIYTSLKKDFETYAFQFSLWNLSTIQGSHFKPIYIKMKKEGFDALGITGYRKSLFGCLIMLKKPYRLAKKLKALITAK